jgi:hypothetical protein
MTRREARRLALLVVLQELSASLDTSDEWVRHPETDDELTPDEVKKVKSEARKIVDELEARAADLDP